MPRLNTSNSQTTAHLPQFQPIPTRCPISDYRSRAAPLTGKRLPTSYSSHSPLPLISAAQPWSRLADKFPTVHSQVTIPKPLSWILTPALSIPRILSAKAVRWTSVPLTHPLLVGRRRRERFIWNFTRMALNGTVFWRASSFQLSAPSPSTLMTERTPVQPMCRGRSLGRLYQVRVQLWV